MYRFIFKHKSKGITITGVANDEYNALINALLTNHYAISKYNMESWVIESKVEVTKEPTVDACVEDFTTLFIKESNTFSVSVAELRKVYEDSLILNALNTVLGNVTWE